jgi:cobalamin biosynthesis Co2+ chelatase CbiK
MKPLVLLAAPGAGSVQDQGFVDLEGELRRACEPVDVGWIYTSSRLLERAKRAGRPALSPGEGLACAQAHDGPVVILSLHLVNGREFGHLVKVHAACGRRDIILSRPLFESADSLALLAHALHEENPIEDDEVRVVITHGTPEPEGMQSLAEFGASICSLDGRTVFTSLLGEPDFAAVVEFCNAHGVARASLVPLLLTGGPTTQSLTNPEDPVLAPLRAAGISTRSGGRALLRVPLIRNIWRDRLQALLKQK